MTNPLRLRRVRFKRSSAELKRADVITYDCAMAERMRLAEAISRAGGEIRPYAGTVWEIDYAPRDA